MESTQATPSAASMAPSEAPLSVWSRAAAVFTRPSDAWRGLETRAQWWFPLVLMILINVAMSAALHERAILPMITERWEQQVESGNMSPEQVDRMVEMMSGPTGIAINSGQQLLAWPVIMLLLAAGIAFGVGFVLGTKLRFRHAFEVVNWASLVLLPSYVLVAILAWSKQTMQGIHLGLGILVPESESPGKLQVALASFLDAFGPFNLWCLFVVIVGASALSGAPRKSVTWVLGGLYAALAVFLAALAAVFTPAG